MWMTVMAGVGKFLSAISSLLGAVLKYMAIVFAYRLGIRRQQQKDVEHAAKVKDEQLEIAARPVEHRSDIIERMRRAGL